MKKIVNLILSFVLVSFTFACGGGAGSSSSDADEVTIQFSEASLPATVLALESSNVVYGVHVGDDYETGCDKDGWQGTCTVDINEIEANDNSFTLALYYLKEDDSSDSADVSALKVHAAKKPIFNSNKSTSKSAVKLGEVSVKITSKLADSVKGNPIGGDKPIIDFDAPDANFVEVDAPGIEVQLVEVNFPDSEKLIQVSNSNEEVTFSFTKYGREEVTLTFFNTEDRCLAQDHRMTLTQLNFIPPNRYEGRNIERNLDVGGSTCFSYTIPASDENFTYKQNMEVTLTNESDEPMEYLVRIKKKTEITSLTHAYYSGAMGEDLLTFDKYTMNRSAIDSPMDYSFAVRNLYSKSCLDNVTMKFFDIENNSRTLVREFSAGAGECASVILPHDEWNTDLEVEIHYYGHEVREYVLHTEHYPIFSVNETVTHDFDELADQNGLFQSAIDLNNEDKYELEFSVSDEDIFEMHLDNGFGPLYFRVISLTGEYKENGYHIFREGRVNSNYGLDLPEGSYKLEIYNVSGQDLVSFPLQFARVEGITSASMTYMTNMFARNLLSNRSSRFGLDLNSPISDFNGFAYGIVNFKDQSNEVDICSFGSDYYFDIYRGEDNTRQVSTVAGLNDDCENHRIRFNLGTGVFTIGPRSYTPESVERLYQHGNGRVADPRRQKISFSIEGCNSLDNSGGWTCQD